MNDRAGLRRRCQRSAARRGGLSLLEFLGCLIALVGGAWLGAIYLGINLRHLVYVALVESEMIDKVPEQWRPVGPAGGEGAPTPAELAQAVQGELVALREEIAALRTSSGLRPQGEEASTTSVVPPAESDTAKKASLAYWSRMQDVVHHEIALQRSAEQAASEGNATKVAALKGRICRFASSAIRAIPTEGVDRAATDFGNDLAQWYERGGGLYEQAVRIWESPARSQSGPALTKEWDQAQAQHRNEGRLLRDKVSAAGDSLTRRFGEGFTEITGF